MKYIVKNLTRRPVSIQGNSGKSYHLPPKYEHELADIEIEDNAFIGKLQSRNVLDVKALDANEKPEDEEGGDRKTTADKSDSRAKSGKKDK